MIIGFGPYSAEIQKIMDKRAILIADVTMNGKYIPNYQRKLTRYCKEIERLYRQGRRV